MDKKHSVITCKHAPPIAEWAKLFRGMKYLVKQHIPFINSDADEIAHWRRSLLIQLFKDLRFQKVCHREQKFKLKETQNQLRRLVVGESWIAFHTQKFNGMQQVCRTLFEFVPTWHDCYIVENDCKLRDHKSEYNIYTPNDGVQTEIVTWLRPSQLILDTSLRRWLVHLFQGKISKDCVLHICSWLVFN